MHATSQRSSRPRFSIFPVACFHTTHTYKWAFCPTPKENATGDGVRREYFRLLAAELTNPDTGRRRLMAQAVLHC